MIWHTARERALIKAFGGAPLKKYGTDGVLYNKRPVEVRNARTDYRFRIQQDIHNELLKKDGYYIFEVEGEKPLLYTARQVDQLLPAGKWFKDRDYPHKFLKIEQVF